MVIFKPLLVKELELFVWVHCGKVFSEQKYAQREYVIELNLTVCTYVPLFKGESYYSTA